MSEEQKRMGSRRARLFLSSGKESEKNLVHAFPPKILSNVPLFESNFNCSLTMMSANGMSGLVAACVRV